jgi:hypothetical protein
VESLEGIKEGCTDDIDFVRVHCPNGTAPAATNGDAPHVDVLPVQEDSEVLLSQPFEVRVLLLRGVLYACG